MEIFHLWHYHNWPNYKFPLYFQSSFLLYLLIRFNFMNCHTWIIGINHFETTCSLGFMKSWRSSHTFWDVTYIGVGIVENNLNYNPCIASENTRYLWVTVNLVCFRPCFNAPARNSCSENMWVPDQDMLVQLSTHHWYRFPHWRTRYFF